MDTRFEIITILYGALGDTCYNNCEYITSLYVNWTESYIVAGRDGAVMFRNRNYKVGTWGKGAEE